MPTESDPDIDRAMCDGNIEFALTAYAGVRDQGGNLFFSPYSISSALAMAYAGARGETERQMARALHLPIDRARVHANFAALNRRLNGEGQDRPYQLSVANALWGAKGLGFRNDFRETVEKAYGGALSELDFASAPEACRATINRWVEIRTEGKIRDLLTPASIRRDTGLVLTNAIYFKARWTDPFDERLTTVCRFWLPSRQKVKVPLMEKTGRFRYLADADFQALEMRYAGEELAMLVVLPERPDGLAMLEASLTGKKLSSIISGLREREVMAQVPRFKLSEHLELGKLLPEMGMALAFSSEADFSAMADNEPLFFSQAIHKAHLEVDEEGTEAAAATAVVMLRGLSRSRPVVFRADHPFLFVILDAVSGSILFIGRVMNPAL